MNALLPAARRLAGLSARLGADHTVRWVSAGRSLSFKPNWDKVSPKQAAAPPPGGPAVPPPGYEPLPPREDWGAPPPAPPPPAPPAAPGQIVPTTNLNAVQVRASLETLLSEPYIAIQRRLELANLLIGFEQANHYTLYNRHGQIVGYMAEENTSMSGTVMRQLAKTHRPFTATIFDPAGSILMTVERPFYFVSTSLFVRDAYKNDMGEVHMNWYSTQEHCVVRVTL